MSRRSWQGGWVIARHKRLRGPQLNKKVVTSLFGPICFLEGPLSGQQQEQRKVRCWRSSSKNLSVPYVLRQLWSKTAQVTSSARKLGPRPSGITEADMTNFELSHSAPASPSADRGPDLHETAAVLDDNPTSGIQIEGRPFALEHVYDYEPGGHHPVQLGDVFDDGRHRVIHKLGSGGYANVWLCRDLAAPTPKYVALKILMAEASTEDCPELMWAEQLKSTMGADETAPICAPLRHFRTDGPNGSHFCFVYPVLGPSVSSGLLNSSKDPDRTLRGICHQTAAAMASLHALDICHGGQKSLKC